MRVHLGIAPWIPRNGASLGFAIDRVRKLASSTGFEEFTYLMRDSVDLLLANDTKLSASPSDKLTQFLQDAPVCVEGVSQTSDEISIDTLFQEPSV
jgi:hypothetical protein